MDIRIKADDLLKWSRYFDDIPRKTPQVLANALNYIGGNVVDEVSDYLSSQTDLDPEDIKRLIQVDEATPDNLNWEMDASMVAPPSLDWSQPWARRETPSFEAATLVKVVTMDDEIVCQKCQDAAEGSPYTLQDAQQMLPIHPNCRCVLSPWYSYRRLPVTFARPGAAGPQLVTIKQLSKAIKDQLQIAMSTANVADTPQQGLWFWD